MAAIQIFILLLKFITTMAVAYRTAGAKMFGHRIRHDSLKIEKKKSTIDRKKYIVKAPHRDGWRLLYQQEPSY